MEEEKKIIPVNRKLAFIVSDTLRAIRSNFDTQNIYPYEVYPGYREKNAKADKGSWKSTGRAYRTLRGRILSDKIDDIHLDFTYMYYMRFVDMGVGKNRPLDKVSTQLDARHDVRYVTRWDPGAGFTHRPSLRMEFKYQARRLENYWYNQYDMAIRAVVLGTLDGLEINIGEEKDG